jgi:DNA-binding NarL/FixJ family response regulator
MANLIAMNAPTGQTTALKTLIVEDNNLVRQGLKHVVESTRGLRLACEAADVPEALLALREQEPSVAILDLKLPSGSGLEILHYIRKSNPACRVIIFSGTMTDWEAEACRFAGAEHCFNKVLDFDRLRKTLRDWGDQTRTAQK